MRACLIASAVLLLAFAPAPLPRREKARDHQALLAGNWHVRTIKWRGRDHYQAAGVGDDLIVTKNQRVVIARGRITFEASAGGGFSSPERAITFDLSGSGEVR